MSDERLREEPESSMNTLDAWLADASEALSLPPGLVTEQVRDDLLDLTRDIAHNVARIAGPLTCYLVGMAVVNGADPAQAVIRLQEMIAAREPSPEAKPKT